MRNYKSEAKYNTLIIMLEHTVCDPDIVCGLCSQLMSPMDVETMSIVQSGMRSLGEHDNINSILNQSLAFACPLQDSE